jgi:hypothetical protein
MGRVLGWSLALLVATSPAVAHAQDLIHHELAVVVLPAEHRIQVTDTITLPTRMQGRGAPIPFLLHGGLSPRTTTPGVAIQRDPTAPFTSPTDHRVPVERYSLRLPVDTRVFTLSYGGEIAHSAFEQERDVRSADETPGMISPDGIFLASSSLWYPTFDDSLVTFTLDAQVPAEWEAISQGEQRAHQREGDVVRVGWTSPHPQEEIYLVGGPLTRYTKVVDAVTAMAFLRTPDQPLAERYLDATAQYLSLYSALLGAYPYRKFALVENFWETGYGMPSFTLLGSRVIRLPFILHSSYPHEILHNWWGNGVFVDGARGNWSEGLTAYLADHLIAEQRGTGVEYRRATLQKYADYVVEGKDFPLTQFRARHSAATEAVGYGKTLMLFHMLRRQLGDDTFVRALRRFYTEHRFRRATFSDLGRAFSTESGTNVEALMVPWIEKAGAPMLRVSHAKAEVLGNQYLLTSQIEQIQPGAAYRLRVPVAVTLEGREQAYQTTFKLDTKQLGLELIVPGRPLRFDIDPEFDLFRRLDRAEIPPALSGLFGAERVTIVLPSTADDSQREGYRRLADSWKTAQPGEVDVVSDHELTTLPLDRAVWVFGWENRLRPVVASALAEQAVVVTDSVARIGTVELKRANHSVVLVSRHPANPASAVGWLAVDRVAALPGLARKLPHYGKYGFLGFEGDDPTNRVKGEWRIARSPMSVAVEPTGGVSDVPMGALAPRRALAVLPAEPSSGKP